MSTDSDILSELNSLIEDDICGDIDTITSKSSASESELQKVTKPGTANPLPISASELQSPEIIRTGTHIAVRCHRIYEDHHYGTSPRSLKTKLRKSKNIISTLRNESRLQKQKMLRLKNRVTSLTEMFLQYVQAGELTSSQTTLSENQVVQLSNLLTNTLQELLH